MGSMEFPGVEKYYAKIRNFKIRYRLDVRIRYYRYPRVPTNVSPSFINTTIIREFIMLYFIPKIILIIHSSQV